MRPPFRSPQSNTRSSELPIAIFDSGVGGLTVYRTLHAQLPDEHFLYLGDTARVPYGTKSLRTVERYAVENSLFLESRGIKLLVVACNTASALALNAIRSAVSVPVIGVIEPGARAATKVAKGKTIGVIATEATVHSHAYSDAIAQLAPGTNVIERACPLFVPLAEEGWAETDVARSVAGRYLEDFRSTNIAALVLGCTHYPILRQVIGDILGPRICLIDSGEATAAEVYSVLADENLCRKEEQRGQGGRERRLCDDLDHFYVTDAAHRFATVAERFLGAAPAVLEAVEIWGTDELRTD